MNEKDIKNISKFLSLILRHSPETIHLKLDENGWADVEELITKSNKNRKALDFETLQYVVETNDKKRFTFNEDLTKIRANQGHSISVDLELQPQTPPDELYHGTVAKFIDTILKDGIQKMNRQHVHLSKDKETAIKVGNRRGTAIILKINTHQMAKDGYLFYCSENGVWLTDEVPPKYIQQC
ncbi:RNA 2'-phosphotransferase [Flavobacterium columnare]|uniref:Probable RNA 2'-phosphotransferase n=1 Tax=Flavobacterium columnare TaxID=996 RepID=A0AAI8GAW0_9FLAO|nr:RNA 2'-phosphotransferase [Flavobacterium columnare]AMO20308.1 RNA 2'-phosphotransferase [Flavobacterium columnare]AUX18267.1 RNA 2'-phosphotransferase [Flavobacterium columnare]QOG57343.1 RNA 2'-phosphotransferase [Flavobacterium columnare]QOG60067.1 RNA 2'-phosphotransferase [Flavobacterium columnare]QOG62787.1 RNA 2'-phosphotransferase [Flavobacterium columnare]